MAEDAPTQPKRRQSVVEFEKLENVASVTVKVENLSDAKPIKQDELKVLTDKYAALE